MNQYGNLGWYPFILVMIVLLGAPLIMKNNYHSPMLVISTICVTLLIVWLALDYNYKQNIRALKRQIEQEDDFVRYKRNYGSPERDNKD